MRCDKCRYRTVILTKCKCGKEYCLRDILPEKHNCERMDLFKKDAYDKNEKILMDAVKKEKVDWLTT